MKFQRHWLAPLGCLFTIMAMVRPSQAQYRDLDHDGINDILEQRLAREFAPEWRFQWHVDGDHSNQNNNESFLPSSVEWLRTEDCQNQFASYHAPFLEMCQAGCPFVTVNGTEDENIYYLDQLGSPPYDDPNNDGLYRVDGYCKYVGGDPSYFPTYFHALECPQNEPICQPQGPTIQIQYYLFFPWDFTSNNFPVGEKGSHRGDWENIAVVIGGVPDFSVSDVPPTAELRKVIYYGHFMPGKVVSGSEISTADGRHPRVFVGWGTHAMYPESGELHNALVGPISYSGYDDYFWGQGLRVASWLPGRELLNFGEYNLSDPTVSFQRWIRFRGQWGPDGDVSQGSPLSPPFRGRWCTPGCLAGACGVIGIDGCSTGVTCNVCASTGRPDNPIALWDQIVNCVDLGCWWDSGLNQRDMTSVPPYGAGALLFETRYWGPGEYIYITEDMPQMHPLVDGKVMSVYLMGGAKLTLYSEYNYGGQSQTFTHSCPDLEFHNFHEFGNTARSARLYYDSTVYVDASNRGYQDGSPSQVVTSGPYRTVYSGVEAVSPGGLVLVRPGIYPEDITLDKPVTIMPDGAGAKIGTAALGN